MAKPKDIISWQKQRMTKEARPAVLVTAETLFLTEILGFG
jgi:hypothetical protein